MSKNLINFSDLTKKDIFDLIELANNFKSEDLLDYRSENLFPDKKIVSIFCEPSTRTKLSFEIAAHNLGAKFIDFDLSNSSMNKLSITKLFFTELIDSIISETFSVKFLSIFSISGIKIFLIRFLR